MYQGTTPALTFNVSGGGDMSAMTPFVSFKRGPDVLTKTGNDVVMAYDSEKQVTVVICQLTQEETLALRPGEVTVQMRFIDQYDNAYATEESTINVERVIYQEVIRYGGST